MTVLCDGFLIEWLPPADARLESALPDDARPEIPAAAATGLERLFAAWLERCGIAAPPARSLPSADGAPLSLALALWLGPRLVGEIRFDGVMAPPPVRHEGVAHEAHHLLFRLFESTLRALGREASATVIHGFDDYRTGSLAALLAYFAAAAGEGDDRRRGLVRAFELDPSFGAPRLALAEERLENGDAAASARLIEGVAVQDPDRARELGLSLWSRGEVPAALQLLSAAVENNADDGLAHAALAALLARQGETQEAFLLASRASNLIPDDYRSWAALADVHRAGGQHQEAAFYYAFALRLAPDAPHLLKDAAASQLAAGRPAEAMALAQRAIAAAPNDAENYANLALAQRQLGDQPGALEAARRAVALGGNDPRFAALLAELG